MSTRQTIIYNQETGVHLYIEDGAVHVEQEFDNGVYTADLMLLADWIAAGMPTEPKRGAPVTGDFPQTESASGTPVTGTAFIQSEPAGDDFPRVEFVVSDDSNTAIVAHGVILSDLADQVRKLKRKIKRLKRRVEELENQKSPKWEPYTITYNSGLQGTSRIDVTWDHESGEWKVEPKP